MNQLTKPDPTIYLIKRDPKLTDLGSLDKSKKTGKILFETNGKNAKPSSSKLDVGDILYVAETGGGSIYARAVVTVIHEPVALKNLSEVIIFRRDNKRRLDDKFFLDRLDGYEKELADNNEACFIIQFYETEQEILPQNVPLTGGLETLKWWQGINKLKPEHLNYISNPDALPESDLNTKIPGALRLQLWSFFSTNQGIGHLIDVDHFVPKSLGAPGNIVQNLVPVGFSLNRYKSDSIPKGFFIVSRHFFNGEFKEEVNKALADFEQFNSDNNIESDFFTGNLKKKYTDLARRIIQHLHNKNEYPVKDAKRFYLSVMEKHLEDYPKMIKDYENIS